MSVQNHKKDFLILYGSQTGQAEAISEEIFDRSHKEGFNCLRYCLSQTEKKFSIDKEACVVFVCSTTGEGETPDTASKFVRRLKKKTLPTDYLQNLTFAFLALGDSNYTSFCNCGKTVDARLQALGAKHFYETGFADDAVGLEVVVEPWVEQLFPALRKHLGKTVSSTTSPSDKTTFVDQILTCNNEGLLSEENKLSNGHNSTDSNEQQGMDTMVTANLKSSVLPLSTAALKIPSKPDAYLELKFLEDEGSALTQTETTYNSPSAATRVHKVPIISARRLTRDYSLVKKALEVELDITGIEFDFQPGDSFGIVCANRDVEINYLIARFGIEEIADKKLTLTIIADTKKKAPTIPEHIQLPSTLRKILRCSVDFKAVPRKGFLRMLVDYTTDEKEKRRLQELCSVQGGKDYTAFIREQNIGLVEILRTFESCKPPVERVLEFLPRLLPREYSVASSPLKLRTSVKFVFNVIELPAFDNQKRFGLCTKCLDDLTSRMRGEDDENDVTAQLQDMRLDNPMVHVYFRKPTDFRFPVDVTLPVIMIGPGTGIAPFIGFLEHREQLLQSTPDVKLGRGLLFYGCRYKDKDFLYKSEISRFQDVGVLDKIHCSYSRDKTTDPNLKYVQDNIRQYKDDVMRIFLEENGIVFICGDAKHMGRDVTNTFVNLIEEYKGLAKVDAIKYLDELRKKKQFLEDVWT